MTKKELLEEAQELGLEVTKKNTKVEIQKALDEAIDAKKVVVLLKGESIAEVIAPPKINIETEPIPEQETVSYEDHIKAGFVNLSQSEGLQKQGKRVVEIKNIGGFILHRLEKI